MRINLQDADGNVMDFGTGNDLLLECADGKASHLEWADLTPAVQDELWKLAERAGEVMGKMTAELAMGKTLLVRIGTHTRTGSQHISSLCVFLFSNSCRLQCCCAKVLIPSLGAVGVTIHCDTLHGVRKRKLNDNCELAGANYFGTTSPPSAPKIKTGG